MIDARPSLHAAAGLPAVAVAKYLRSTGWKAQRSQVIGVTVLVKALPNVAEPIRIVLPEKASLDDERRRVADALRTLEAFEERSVQTIADEVRQIANGTISASKRGMSQAVRRNRSNSSR